MLEETHIASMIIQASPSNLVSVSNCLDSYSGISVPIFDDTKLKLIVVIEAPSEEELRNAIDLIGKTSGVVNATLVYHYIDRES